MDVLLFDVEGGGPRIYTELDLKEKGFKHIEDNKINDPYMTYRINKIPTRIKQDSLILNRAELRTAKVNQGPIIHRISELFDLR